MSEINLPLILGDKDNKIKIMRILDEINLNNIVFSQDKNEPKKFHIKEKMNNSTKEKNFIGVEYSDSTSKYLLFKYNKSSNKLETYPASDWYNFTIDNTFIKTQNENENNNSTKKENNNDNSNEKDVKKKRVRKKNVELSKEKNEQQLLSLFKKNNTENPVKGRRIKNTTKGNTRSNENISNKDDFQENNFNEDDEEANIPNKNDNSSIDRDMDDKPSVHSFSSKSLPSSLEEIIKPNKNANKNEEDGKGKKNSNNDLPFEEEEFEDEEDEIDLDADDESEQNNDFDQDLENAGNALGLKRTRDEKIKDKETSIQDLMLETLQNMLSQNNRMTYIEIVKEFINDQFSNDNIENYLQTLLEQNTKTFCEKGYTYYFLKKK